MASQQTVNAMCKCAQPILSTNFCQARTRVLGLYRAFYRFIPYIVKYYDIPKTEWDVRMKIREYFYKNACVTDFRVIDVLVLKGYMELQELRHTWQQKGHVMAHWHPTAEPKPCNFIGKFLSGVE